MGFVQLTEKEAIWAEMLMEMLRNNGIPCISSPVYGAGLVVSAGVRERRKVFVPTEHFIMASDLLDAFFSENEAEIENE